MVMPQCEKLAVDFVCKGRAGIRPSLTSVPAGLIRCLERARAGGREDFLVLALWFLLVPVSAHLAFSSLGYNPTDDGQMLAYSRDMLLGQVPHRDVGSFHMAGTFFLWQPVVLFGGDYTFWIARGIVWFEHALIAWLWVLIVTRLLGIAARPAERFLLAALTFIFDIHTFPIMPWHTTDALLFLSLGLAVVTGNNRRWRLVGYGLIGMSYLFRQNFLPIAPLCLLLLNDRRSPRAWLAVAAPGLMYSLYLLATSALPDAISQLTTERGLSDLAYFAYVNQGRGIIPAFLLGFVIMAIGHTRVAAPSMAAAIGVPLLVAAAVLSLAVLHFAQDLSTGDIAFAPSFALLGLTAGATTFFLVERRHRGHLRAGAIVLAVAWVISISIGYNTPAAADGIMILLLICFVRSALPGVGRGRVTGIILFAGLTVVTAISTRAFVSARENHIYRDQPAQNLTYRLDNIFPGGAMLRTNRNTYQYLLDLKRIVARARGRPYAILPDCPGWWAKSSQPDWIPIPWPAVIEIDNPSIQERIIEALNAHRGHALIIVSRYDTAQLALGTFNVPPIANPITWYVYQNFRKVGQTHYFDLYE
jgi:hypothetical protein